MKRLCIIVSMFALTSCAVQEQKIKSSALKSGNSLQLQVGKRYDFNMMTGGTAGSWGLLGPLGTFGASASAASNGEEVVRKNNIADPAIDIARDLGQKLQSRYKLNLLNSTPIMLETNDADIIRQMHHDADYQLNVLTGWGTIHNLVGDLAVMTQFQMRLTETATGDIIASATCNERTDHKYGLDELRDNNAEKLKQALLSLQRKCKHRLSDILLN